MKIFLATHGKMASGMKSSIGILLGDTEALTVYDAYLEGQPDRLKENIEAFLEKEPEDEPKLLISDIYGGSVNQQMLRSAQERNNTYVITGVNLGLLMELVSSAEEEFSVEKLDAIIESSRQMTMRVVLDFGEKEEDFF